MKRCLTVLLAFGWVAWAAPAAGAAEFKTYVGCGLSREAVPADVCYLGDSIGAFFRVDGADVEYEVCVEFPDGEYLCAEDQAASEGTLYVNSITSEALGAHRVEWYVEDALINTWSFDLAAERPPPAPELPPATTPAPVAPSGPSERCLKARTRVRALNTKIRVAKRRAAKERLREKMKVAKANRNILC